MTMNGGGLMQGRQPEDWGVPLWEAIERWTPGELWEPYRELKEYDIPLIVPGRDDPRSEEVRRLRSRITEILVHKLARGELIASGVALPLKETSRRRRVRPELWPHLAFSWGFREVVGNGLRYAEILIRKASPAADDVPAISQDVRRPQESPHHAPRGPGRPSIMTEIEAEMRRRAASGMIEESLRREANELARWAQQFADAHVPKPKSIEKKLAQVYRQLKTTKRPDKSDEKL